MHVFELLLLKWGAIRNVAKCRIGSIPTVEIRLGHLVAVVCVPISCRCVRCAARRLCRLRGGPHGVAGRRSLRLAASIERRCSTRWMLLPSGTA